MNRKKIITTMITLAMLLTMVMAFGVVAHAADGAIEVTTSDQWWSAINNANAFDSETPTVIDIQADILDLLGSIGITDKNIVVNLNGHKLHSTGLIVGGSSKLTIYGMGEIRGASHEYGNSEAIAIMGNSTVIIKNCKVFGASGTASVAQGRDGINMIETASLFLDNVLVQSGDSLDGADSNSAIGFDSNNTIDVNNSTFRKGAGKLEGTDSYVIGTRGVKSGSVYENGKKITLPTDSSVAELIVGAGYANLVTGSVINQDNGTPARASTPVTANATIPAPTYTVTIPTTISFGSVNGALEKYRDQETDKAGNKINVETPFTVSATGVDNFFDGKKLTVSIGATGEKITLTGGTNVIDCKLKKADADYETGSEFAEFVNDVDLAKGTQNVQMGAVSINRCDITESAEYTGTMAFTIGIKGGN